MEKNTEIKVPSLSKALKLLDYFDDSHKACGVTELARYAGLPKSSVQNIVSTFKAHGYLVQDSRTRKYMLGGEIVSLFSKYKRTRNLNYRVTSYLQTIRDSYDVEAYLAELDTSKWNIIYLASEQPKRGDASFVSKVGQEAPIHATAAGKILMGLSPEEIRETYFKFMEEKAPEAYTKSTVTDHKKLMGEMTEAAYRGYALCEGEYHEDIYAISVPVIVGFDDVRYAIGAIKKGSFYDYVKKELIGDLTDCARKMGSFLQNK